MSVLWLENAGGDIFTAAADNRMALPSSVPAGNMAERQRERSESEKD